MATLRRLVEIVKSRLQAALSTTSAVFLLFLLAHSVSALRSPIQDCDETFNFWEPTHYLNHGYGMQTWELSPVYAIRSWLYTTLHAVAIYLVTIISPSTTKSAEFYSLRFVLGTVCAACETRLFNSISRAINQRVALIFLVICTTSAGVFHASVSYLPSSFAMYTAALALADFMDPNDTIRTSRGITWLGFGAVVGWPFVAILSVPFAMGDLIASWMRSEHTKALLRLVDGFVQSLLILVFQVCTDSFFYRKFTSVPINIVLYNVMSKPGKGPDIYGTEPWHFYARNLLINFGVWFPLAFGSLPLLLLHHSSGTRVPIRLDFFRALMFLSPFYLWLLIFTLQPHKEERFMYPAYPCLALNASISFHILVFHFGKSTDRFPKWFLPSRLKLLLVAGFVLLAIFSGLGRIAGLTTGYSAPLEIYRSLHHHSIITQNQDTMFHICLGKEWYRYPSSYHIPSNVRLKFIRSDFNGLLPGEFSEEKSLSGFYPGAWQIPHGMNDRNIEDSGKYSDLSTCDFLVDSSFPGRQNSDLEPDFQKNQETWDVLDCLPFLDAVETGMLGRLFWIPQSAYIPHKWQRKWGSYCLLGRRLRKGG